MLNVVTVFSRLVLSSSGVTVVVVVCVDVSFIAVDYDLGGGDTGDTLSDLLFENKKSVPSIVFSGKDLSSGTKRFLEDKGFTKILSKVDGTIGSDLIEDTVNEILTDCYKRNYDIRMKSRLADNGKYPLEFNDSFKTIDEWIELLSKCEYAEHEHEIRRLIIDHCHAIVKRKMNRDL